MQEVEYTLITKTGSEIYTIKGGTEYDEEKWEKILDICNYRKASIIELIKTYLDTLTPEKADEILFNWDI